MGTGNARDHLNRDPCRCEGGGLFTAATEDKRVTAFQPHHTLSSTRVFDHHLDDVLLCGRRTVWCLADIDHFGALGELDQFGSDEAIVE